jgi:hypothetical protein
MGRAHGIEGVGAKLVKIDERLLPLLRVHLVDDVVDGFVQPPEHPGDVRSAGITPSLPSSRNITADDS